MRRSCAIVVIAALMAVLASTSAAATTVSAGQWAPKFCAALSTFQAHLNRDGTKASAVLSGNITSLAEAKATLAGFMAKAVNDADTAISAVKAAGAPSAVNGTKIAAAFVKGLQNARSLFASARTKAQHLPTKTLSAFESSTQKITSDLNQGSKGIATSFNTVKALDSSGKVGAAVRAEPTCAFLQSS
jgi:hypothetical protein